MNLIFLNIRRRLGALARSMRNGMSEKKFLCLVAILVGLLAGIGAALLKDFINALSGFIRYVVPADVNSPVFIILPIVGVVLCGIYSRYVVKDNMEGGCERISLSLKQRNYYLPRHLTYSPIIACALTIGFGGSAGSEGPIAYTGAAIGSNVGKYFKFPPDMCRVLVIIGGAAGIAGIFKAPIGGAMFAIEVLAMPMTTVSVTALIFACLSAGLTAYIWSGFTLDISYLPKNFFAPETIGAVILLGIFCGLYSLYYSRMMSKTETLFRRISNPWIKNVSSGLLIGLLIFCFPVLYGEGYGVVGQVINGCDADIMRDTWMMDFTGPWVLILFVAGTLMVKMIATAATNSGGGVGGDFAPTLFAGAMAGLLFAYTSNTLLGTHLNVANFAFFGMAGVMAGAIQAPLMAIFLTVEMVGDFGMILPLSLSAMFSFFIVRLARRHITIHPTWLHNLDSHLKGKL